MNRYSFAMAITALCLPSRRVRRSCPRSGPPPPAFVQLDQLDPFPIELSVVELRQSQFQMLVFGVLNEAFVATLLMGLGVHDVAHLAHVFLQIL